MPAPANDNFADALLLSSPGTVNGDTTEATIETGEPNLWTANDRSVWYKFEPTESGYWTVQITSAVANGVLQFILRTGPNLTSLTYLDGISAWGGSLPNPLIAGVTAGTTYYLQVFTGWNTTTGSANPPVHGAFAFTWSFEEADPPVNDLFADAQVITGTSGTVAGELRGARPDPNFGDFGGDVWYKWTAPFDGTAKFDTRNTEADDGSYIQAYSGTYPGLTEVSYADGYWQNDEFYVSVTMFEVVSGTTYWIWYNASGSEMAVPTQPITLNWNLVPAATGPPANDDWADAVLLTGATGSIAGTILGATAEPDEDSWQQTVWYKVVLPSSNTAGTSYEFWTEGLPFAELALYEYDNSWPYLDGLSQWWSSNDDRPPDYADPQIIETLYYYADTNGNGNDGVWYLRVANYDVGWTGNFTLHWTQPPPPEITSITPTSGAVGTVIHIHGENFTGSGWRSVLVGGANTTNVTFIDDGHITATTQVWHNHSGNAHGPYGKVRVYTDYGWADSEEEFLSPPPLPPIIDSFTPASAYWNETTVTVAGSRLTGVTEARLGDTSVAINPTDGWVGGDTSLQFFVPSRAPAVPIELRHHTASGTSAATLDVYQYTHQPVLSLRHVLTSSGDPALAPTPSFPMPTIVPGTFFSPNHWHRLQGDASGAVAPGSAWDATYLRWDNDYASQLSGTYTQVGPPGRGEVRSFAWQSGGDWVQAERGFNTNVGQNGPGASDSVSGTFCVLTDGRILGWFTDANAVTRAYGSFFFGFEKTGSPVVLTLAQVPGNGNLTVTALGQYVGEQYYLGYWGFTYNFTGEPYWIEVQREEQDVLGQIQTLAGFPGTTYAVMTYLSVVGGIPRAEVIDCSGSVPVRTGGGSALALFGRHRLLAPTAGYAWPGYTFQANPDYSPPFNSHADYSAQTIVSRGIDATRMIHLGHRTPAAFNGVIATAVVTERNGTTLTAGAEALVLDSMPLQQTSFVLPRKHTDLVRLADGRFLFVLCPIKDMSTGGTYDVSTWVTYFRVLTIDGTNITVGPLSGPWRRTPRSMPGAIYPYAEGDFLLVDTWPPRDNRFVNQFSHKAWGSGATQRVQAFRAESDGTVHPITEVVSWPTSLTAWGQTADNFPRYYVGGRFLRDDNNPTTNTLPAPIISFEYPFSFHDQIAWNHESSGYFAGNVASPVVLTLVDLEPLVPLPPEPEPPPEITALTAGVATQGLRTRRTR